MIISTAKPIRMKPAKHQKSTGNQRILGRTYGRITYLSSILKRPRLIHRFVRPKLPVPAHVVVRVQHSHLRPCFSLEPRVFFRSLSCLSRVFSTKLIIHFEKTAGPVGYQFQACWVQFSGSTRLFP